jgi:hypothetical protein
MVLPHFLWCRFVSGLQEATRLNRHIRITAQITESADEPHYCTRDKHAALLMYSFPCLRFHTSYGTAVWVSTWCVDLVCSFRTCARRCVALPFADARDPLAEVAEPCGTPPGVVLQSNHHAPQPALSRSPTSPCASAARASRNQRTTPRPWSAHGLGDPSPRRADP